MKKATKVAFFTPNYARWVVVRPWQTQWKW